MQGAAGHDAGERVVGPVGRVAFRHHVRMAGESRNSGLAVPSRAYRLSTRCNAVAEGQAPAGEAEALQRGLQHVERALVFRRDGRSADQLLRQGYRFDHGFLPG